jgi:ketosteroid isomerase-like protein
MSQENVERVRRAYAFWNEDEVDAFLEMSHPELVFTTSGAFPGFDPVYRGREGMARFRDTMLEAWETFRIEATEFAAYGDWVVIAVRFIGKGRTSGVEVDIAFHHAAHFRDGLIDRLISTPRREQALEAAGLSE